MNLVTERFFPNFPLARYELFSGNDVLAVQNYVSTIIARHQLSSSSRRPVGQFRHCEVDLGDVSLDTMSYEFENEDFVIDCPSVGNDYRFQITLNGNGLLAGRSSHVFGKDRLVMLQPHMHLKETLSPNYRHLMVKLKREALENTLESLLGRPLNKELRFRQELIDIQGPIYSLLNYVGLLCTEYDLDQTLYTSSRIRRSSSNLLLQLALGSLQHNYSDQLNAPPANLSPSYINQIKEYIQANYRDEINLNELARISGYSVRSIFYSFKKFLGVTPMQYLRDYRLAISRELLLNANYGNRTITEIALDCGFSSMSKFAGYYKEKYGELPSETRRQTAL